MLELNRLTEAVAEMGQVLAHQGIDQGRLVEQARERLHEFAAAGPALQAAAADYGAAIPCAEPLDAAFPLPELPPHCTVVGADGAQIQPDRHGAALYYLINIGSLIYRHGSGQTPEPRSTPQLHYRDETLYEDGLLVAGNLLDVRRDQAELAELAERVEQQPPGPLLALVDGTLLLWVLENMAAEKKQLKIAQYVEQFERIRRRGAALVAFTSRPRYGDVGKLLHLATLRGDVQRARSEPNPWERVPDRAILAFLPPGCRSALFASPAAISRHHYGPGGHEIYICYVNVAAAGEQPVIARLEMPQWVVANTALLELAHSAAVAQCRIAGGYPYVLARADELAYISGAERQRLSEMVSTALLRAGLSQDLSPKAYFKSLTRQGRSGS